MKFRFVLLDPSGISPAPLLILIRRNRFRIDCHPFVESTMREYMETIWKIVFVLRRL